MTDAAAIETTEQTLTDMFPDGVTAETRPGYEGYVVSGDRLVEVAKAIRDQLGYNYLSSVTGVDYMADGKLEVVYHAYKISGGGPLVFRAQTDREAPEIPSLVEVWPGAEFQEREVYDMYGVHFSNHPDLRRILMWEGFAGYPLRKDWREAYFEEEGKPFKSRWPGVATRAEAANPYGKNVAYPAGFDPDNWTPEADTLLYATAMQIQKVDNTGLGSDLVAINLGPQHPSTHGVFRMMCTLNGEEVVTLKPVMGYLHRNHEKIGERNTWLMNMPYTDRLDYLSSMSNNFGYALTVEKLLKPTVPERAQYLRVLMAELTRVANHLWAIGFLLNDLGAFFTPALYAIKERELILDLFEETAGSRMMCNYFRFGGVAYDLPKSIRGQETMAFLNELVNNRLPRAFDELDAYLTNNEIIRSRCIDVGVLSAEDAIAYSTAGPVLRASGVAYDVRRAEPYGIYDRFDFDVAVRYNGDVYDRYLIRIDEMRESIRICQQVLRDMPDGGEVIDPKFTKYTYRPPVGEAYGRVENPKGELGFYVVSNRTDNPYRYHVRAPSFINLTPLGKMCEGEKLADVVAVLGSIDIVLGETDR